MTYALLHQHCQSLSPYIKRCVIYDRILALTGINRIVHVRMGLDTSSCRGLYLSARNTDHQLVKQLGGHVIVTARGLSKVMDRFIFIKELMHVFDDPKEATDNGDAFEELLGEFTKPQKANLSPQMESEIDCYWMATSVLCPDAARLQFKQQFAHDPDCLPKIAKEAGIPGSYMPSLFEQHYETTVAAILAK